MKFYMVIVILVIINTSPQAFAAQLPHFTTSDFSPVFSNSNHSNEFATVGKFNFTTQNSTSITDESSSHLGALKALERLNLYHTLISEEGYSALKKSLPECEITWEKGSSFPNRRRA